MPDFDLITSGQLKKRHAKEARFQWYGRIAILISLSFLVFMFAAIIIRGAGAFQQTKIGLNIDFAEQLIDPQGTRDAETLARANYKPLITGSLYQNFPQAQSRTEKRNLYKLCLLYTSPSPRDATLSRMPSSA